MNTIHLLYTIKCVYNICNVFVNFYWFSSCIWRTTRTSFFLCTWSFLRNYPFFYRVGTVRDNLNVVYLIQYIYLIWGIYEVLGVLYVRLVQSTLYVTWLHENRNLSDITCHMVLYFICFQTPSRFVDILHIKMDIFATNV